MNCKPDLARSEDKPSGRILIAAASRLAYGGTEDLMRGECLGAISILRLLFDWGVPVKRILFKI